MSTKETTTKKATGSLPDESVEKTRETSKKKQKKCAEFEENLKNFKQRFPKVETLSISAEKGDGLEELRNHLHETIGNMAK